MKYSKRNGLISLKVTTVLEAGLSISVTKPYVLYTLNLMISIIFSTF